VAPYSPGAGGAPGTIVVMGKEDGLNYKRVGAWIHKKPNVGQGALAGAACRVEQDAMRRYSRRLFFRANESPSLGSRLGDGPGGPRDLGAVEASVGGEGRMRR